MAFCVCFFHLVQCTQCLSTLQPVLVHPSFSWLHNIPLHRSAILSPFITQYILQRNQWRCSSLHWVKGEILLTWISARTQSSGGAQRGEEVSIPNSWGAMWWAFHHYKEIPETSDLKRERVYFISSLWSFQFKVGQARGLGFWWAGQVIMVGSTQWINATHITGWEQGRRGRPWGLTIPFKGINQVTWGLPLSPP